MMWKAAKWGMLSLAVALAIVLAGVVGHKLGEDNAPAARVQQSSGDFGILDEIFRILGEDFVNPQAVDPKVLRAGAINGVLQALGDPHTVYIDPESYALGVDIISGTFEGIGAQVERDPASGAIVIVAPFRDSPAEQAGVRAGDIVRAVDGEPTEGWTVAEAVKRIRGAEGSQVTVKVEHTDGKVEDLTITRGTIVVPTVFVRSDLQDAGGTAIKDLAYIEIQQFTEQTVDDLRKELEGLKDSGYGGLILDLRRNPGGALDATVQVADMFLDSGVILTQVDRDGKRTEYDAKPGGEALDIPVVLLVGPGSASGSEVLAGALRDNHRATLIGEKTFGKGSVNHLRNLSDGGALYVTIARWLTPSGEQIEGVGLSPDVPVSATEEDIAAQRDVQLFAAIDYLHTNVTQAH
ncbi:MAG TPA: S41 family peptidase [Dehalococcoidia bacterium]|nr:S41 family peptidase [Dehalococcoidia bacterium]